MFRALNRRAFGSAGSVFSGVVSRRLHPYTGAMIDPRASRIGVVGATGAVGRVTLELLVDRGYTNIRTFASSRSAGGTPRRLRDRGGDSRRARRGRSRLLLLLDRDAVEPRARPAAAAAGAVCIDKSAAFRLEDGVPLVVPEVNGERALEHTGIVANPNCCAIPLTMVLAPLHEAAGLRSVRVATYQSVSGAGSEADRRPPRRGPDDHRLRMDWEFDGVEFDEEAKLREETRKILELPELPISATCVRVPVVVGHAEAVWVETEEPLRPRGRRADPDERAGTAIRGGARSRPRGRRRRRPRRPVRRRPVGRERPRVLPRLRQPAQGRGTQRGADRRDPDRQPRCRATTSRPSRPEAPVPAPAERPPDTCGAPSRGRPPRPAGGRPAPAARARCGRRSAP